MGAKRDERSFRVPLRARLALGDVDFRARVNMCTRTGLMAIGPGTAPAPKPTAYGGKSRLVRIDTDVCRLLDARAGHMPTFADRVRTALMLALPLYEFEKTYDKIPAPVTDEFEAGRPSGFPLTMAYTQEMLTALRTDGMRERMPLFLEAKLGTDEQGEVLVYIRHLQDRMRDEL